MRENIKQKVGDFKTNPTGENPKDIVKRIADKYEIKWYDMWGICMLESGCAPKRAYNPREYSWGAYQINLGGRMKSRGTVEQAMDWEWATEWVAKRLVATGYHRDRLHAIRLHNGDCREIKVKEGKCKRNNDPYVWRVLELSAQAAREEKIIAEKETKNPL